MATRQLAIALVIALCASTLHAGENRDANVTITFNNDGSGGAFGALQTAFTSKNDVEFIGCGVGTEGLGLSASCSARDSAGVSAFCVTSDPDMVQLMLAISESSFVDFRFDTSRTRTLIIINNYSWWLQRKDK